VFQERRNRRNGRRRLGPQPLGEGPNRRRPGRRPERSQATFGAGAATRGPSGTALRPSPRCLGASSAVPASAGPCGPGRGSGATGAAGRPTGAGAPTRRAAQSAATAATPAAVEASPAPCRAQRRAGALHGGRHDVSESERGRRRARCPPPSARATAPRRPSARPDRTLTAGRALADPANGGSGGATGLVAHSDTRTRKQTA
jgi:hypothetical protein